MKVIFRQRGCLVSDDSEPFSDEGQVWRASRITLGLLASIEGKRQAALVGLHSTCRKSSDPAVRSAIAEVDAIGRIQREIEGVR